MSKTETILWLNNQIDKINKEATEIGEMLLEETDIQLVKVLDRRLQNLEKKMSYLQQKIDFEKRHLSEYE
jgi:hypothetical protein